MPQRFAFWWRSILQVEVQPPAPCTPLPVLVERVAIILQRSKDLWAGVAAWQHFSRHLMLPTLLALPGKTIAAKRAMQAFGDVLSTLPTPETATCDLFCTEQPSEAEAALLERCTTQLNLWQAAISSLPNVLASTFTAKHRCLLWDELQATQASLGDQWATSKQMFWGSLLSQSEGQVCINLTTTPARSEARNKLVTLS